MEWNVTLKININIHQFHFVDYLHVSPLPSLMLSQRQKN